MPLNLFVCEMAVILFRGRWVNRRWGYQTGRNCTFPLQRLNICWSTHFVWDYRGLEVRSCIYLFNSELCCFRERMWFVEIKLKQSCRNAVNLSIKYLGWKIFHYTRSECDEDTQLPYYPVLLPVKPSFLLFQTYILCVSLYHFVSRH